MTSRATPPPRAGRPLRSHPTGGCGDFLVSSTGARPAAESSDRPADVPFDAAAPAGRHARIRPGEGKDIVATGRYCGARRGTTLATRRGRLDERERRAQPGEIPRILSGNQRPSHERRASRGGTTCRSLTVSGAGGVADARGRRARSSACPACSLTGRSTPSTTRATRSRLSTPATSRRRPTWRTATPGPPARSGCFIVVPGPGVLNAAGALSTAYAVQLAGAVHDRPDPVGPDRDRTGGAARGRRSARHAGPLTKWTPAR